MTGLYPIIRRVRRPLLPPDFGYPPQPAPLPANRTQVILPAATAPLAPVPVPVAAMKGFLRGNRKKANTP